MASIPPTNTKNSSDPHSSQLVKSLKEQRDSLRSLLKLKSDSTSTSTSSNRRNQSTNNISEEIDFARKRLRNTYVRLLFESTFTGNARGQENQLWTETTHPLVESHRKVLSSIEKSYQSALANKAGGNGNVNKDSKGRPINGGGGNGNGKKDNLKDLRKAHERESDSYKKFLSSEDLFWQQLASRIVSTYSLNEAKSCLTDVGINLDPDNSLGNVTDLSLANVSSSGLGEETLDMSISGMATGLARASGEGRGGGIGSGISSVNDRELQRAARIPANRERLIEIVHKCLICCGDLARYRELNKRGSKSMSSSSSSTSNNPTSNLLPTTTTTSTTTTTTNPNAAQAEPEFKKAADYYESARRLIPTNGNPSNQLGVISKQLRDPFGAIYHHYRALCVPVPFETAKGNLEVILKEGIKWLDRGGGEKLIREEMLTGSESVEPKPSLLMEELVTFHGMVFTKTRFELFVPLSSAILGNFSSCIKSRSLPADLIVRIIVTGLAASWTTRLWRNSPSASKTSRTNGSKAQSNSKANNTPGQVSNSEDNSSKNSVAAKEREAVLARSVELQILAHVLNLFAALADAGTLELREALDAAGGAPVTAGLSSSEQTTVLARNITAVFRRTLPALRIASKWMKSHLDYIARSKTRALNQSQGSNSTQSQSDSIPDTLPTKEEQELSEEQSRADRKAAEDISLFFHSYVRFVNMLRYAFPFESLPTLNVEGSSLGVNGTPTLDLEEDIDMRGFAPTKKAMLQSTVTASQPPSTSQIQGLGQVHPNEEQLMRIKDLLIDAKVVAESDASGIYFDDENNTFICPQEDGSLSQVHQRSSQQQQVFSTPISASNHPQLASLSRSSPAEINTSPSLQQAVAAAIRNAEPSSPSEAISEADPSESEGRSESTEDVVDLAMRAVGQHQHAGEQRGFTSEEDEEMDQPERNDRMQEDEDDDDERILIPTASLSNLQIQNHRNNELLREAENPNLGSIRSPSSNNASDLLLQVLNGQNSSTPDRPSSSSNNSPGQSNSPQPLPGAQLLFGGNIWSPEPGEVNSVQRGWGGNQIGGAGVSLSNQNQNQNPNHHLVQNQSIPVHPGSMPNFGSQSQSQPQNHHHALPHPEMGMLSNDQLNSQGWAASQQNQADFASPPPLQFHQFQPMNHQSQFQQQQHYQPPNQNHYG